MELSGLSVIEVRNLVSSAVGYAYLGNGFLCMLCILKNSGPRQGRKRNKNPGAWARFWSPNGKHWKPWKTPGSPKSTAVSLFFFFFDSNQTSNALTNQNWQEIENCPTMDGELVCPIMAGVPVCLSCWQNIQCLPGKLTNSFLFARWKA